MVEIESSLERAQDIDFMGNPKSVNLICGPERVTAGGAAAGRRV
jgi:hypothetical protein